MHFTHSNKTEDLITRVSDFMEDNIYPAEEIYASEMKSFREKGNPWQVPSILDELKQKAKNFLFGERFFISSNLPKE